MYGWIDGRRDVCMNEWIDEFVVVDNMGLLIATIYCCMAMHACNDMHV